jgi:type IV pilus assembly protein PilB
MPAQDIKLLDIILQRSLIKPEDYQHLKTEVLATGTSIETLLLKHNLLTQTALSQAKAELFKVPYLDISTVSANPEVLNLLPQTVAERYLVLPFNLDRETRTLSVAMANPVDLQTLEFIERKSGMRLKPFLAEPGRLKLAIEEHYSRSLSTEVTEALKETGKPRPEKISQDITSGVIREAPIAKIVSTLLEFAVKAKASDIHIEPLEDKTRVRYRIDGILYEKLILPKSVHESVISRIKILSGMKIDEKRLPQDGRFNFKTGNQDVDLRISSLPSVFGEKMVMRLLEKTVRVPELADLGLRGMALTNLETAIRVPHGIVLITGPTGSGKTTTLYSLLSKINTPRVNILTLEDPVEYQIPGITQVQINPQARLTFASGLRSFLRQDPNIIMVGEIRDKETAELAIQASLTGHLVFSTLHTNSASGALPRLLDMDMEPFLLVSAMTCIVGQRVCRRICPVCKESYSPAAEVVEDIKKILGPLLKSPDFVLYRGKKCPECNNTGYSGRIGIYEVLPVSEKIGRLILERTPSGKIEAEAKMGGMIDMKQDGYLKVVEGLTTLEEVLRVAED